MNLCWVGGIIPHVMNDFFFDVEGGGGVGLLLHMMNDIPKPFVALLSM